MKIVHALQPLQKSIFLAGPTPRDANTPSWRPDALLLLRLYHFDGTIFVPEADDWAAHDSYDEQIRWEWEALDQASVILFWIPRDIVSMPAFTTNVEFGLKIGQGRCLFGHPKDAPKCSYLDALAKRHNTAIYDNLPEIVQAAKFRADDLHTATLRRS